MNIQMIAFTEKGYRLAEQLLVFKQLVLINIFSLKLVAVGTVLVACPVE